MRSALRRQPVSPGFVSRLLGKKAANSGLLRTRGLPFFLLSGYGAGGVPDELKGAPVLSKPCTPEALKSTIGFVLSNAKLKMDDHSGDASRS
jgi:hypothetical protein